MKLKINWPYLILIIIIATAILFWMEWILIFNMPVKNSSDQIIKIIFVAGIPLILIGLLVKIVRDIQVRITETFISRPSFFFKESRVTWEELKRISRYQAGIHFVGQKHKIVLTPYAYSNYKETFDFITKLND